MGFGPKTPDIESGVQAIKEIVTLLYPEHSTAHCLDTLAAIARAILMAQASLSFETIDQFLRNPEWRQWVLDRTTADIQKAWGFAQGQVLDPNQLDQDFGWLLRDRLDALKDFPDPEDP